MMFSGRIWVAATIITILIIGGFLLSIPRVHKISTMPATSTSTVASTAPSITLFDLYKKGTHTLTGTILAPDACAIVSANASAINMTVSTSSTNTTTTILLALTMPQDTDICLQLPTPTNFSTTVQAPAYASIKVTINGVSATTSAP